MKTGVVPMGGSNTLWFAKSIFIHIQYIYKNALTGHTVVSTGKSKWLGLVEIRVWWSSGTKIQQGFAKRVQKAVIALLKNRENG